MALPQRPLSGRYGSRPQSIPTFQLMSTASKFIAKRVDDYATQEVNDTNADISPVDDIPLKSYRNNAKTIAESNNVTFTSNEMDALLSFKPTDATQPDSNQIKMKLHGKYKSSAMEEALSRTNENSALSNNPLCSTVPIISSQGMIGGIDDVNRWQTSTQIANQGQKSHLDRKLNPAKKLVGSTEPEDMISPITGQRMLNYGTWADDKRAAAAQKSEAVADETDDSDPVMSKLRACMALRGAKGVFGLRRLFRIMDDDNSNSLSFAEFKKAMQEMAMNLSESELVKLFKRFDYSNEGSISYSNFIRVITGSLNARRRRLVNMAFDVLDKDGSGLVTVEDMAMAYDVSKHPEYQSGKKSKEAILLELLDAFEVGGDKDGVVTRQEFENYYSSISASIDNEDYFELMIRNAWHISGGEGAAANTANRRVLVTRADGSQYVEEIKNDLGLAAKDNTGMMARLKAQGVSAAAVATSGFEENKEQNPSRSRAMGSQQSGGGRRPSTAGSVRPATAGPANRTNKPTPAAVANPGIKMLVDKIKKEMKSRESFGFIGLQRRFKIMDDDGSKSLNQAEFRKAMKEMTLDLSDADLRMLFNHFDVDRNGSIDFEEFIAGVRDPMSDKRVALVRKAFNILDKDGSGVVDMGEISSMYDASRHPDVVAKRKTPAQVLREFLDTFDVGGEKDGQVTEEEFINYYANISASIDSEEYFELMIRNAWHISGGEGAAANSSNLRVMVTASDGSERVVALENDLGLKQGDVEGIIRILQRQGVTDIVKINGKPIKASAKSSGISSSSTGQVPVVLKAPPVPGRSSLQATIDRSGTLLDSGRQTAGGLLGRVKAQMQQEEERRKQHDTEQLVAQTLVEVVRVQLFSRGPSGVIDLQRKFIEMDVDGSKSLSREEFKNAMISNQLQFSEEQLNILFKYFDKDQSGLIDYSELLHGLRGQPSPRLLVAVHQAFDRMDREGRNVISPQDLLCSYDATRHPQVR